MKIEDELLSQLREKYGEFNFNEHFDRIEECLNLRKEREWEKYTEGDYTYEGEVLKGTSIPYGRGMFYIQSYGIIYQGWFFMGAKHGYGKEIRTVTGGYIYEGEYSQNEFEGQGTTIWDETGWNHTGAYQSGDKNGYGFLQQDFFTYKGNYVDDLKHGFGEQRYGGNLLYKGMHYQDIMHGWGQADEGVYQYEGEFQMAAKHGFGRKWSDSLDYIYCGKFKDDLKHGRGILKSDGEYKFVMMYKDKAIIKLPIYNFENYMTRAVRRTLQSKAYYWRLMRFMLAQCLNKQDKVV
ncbi:hypothetical protein FGO68_gene15536 [Halteria grandinella]|uniref:MORN repeat-containing protein 3 n=1 Tax=Halteria grandinella TaxID=5974 RepID=A0A8J8NL47_HALGN|nr:hypothetical protein FGO68_gene15536 [Halteria grandinella]